MRQQPSLFDDQRLDLQGSIELSLASLTEYGRRYRHWTIAYSGGKDSSATVTFIAWAVKTGQVPAPESLTVLYADTRQELPPLQQVAMRLLETLQDDGFKATVVLPPLDKRFYVYMLGRGVPPPKNRFRWCTVNLKVDPMFAEMERQRAALIQPTPHVGYHLGDNRWGYYPRPQEKMLSLTGVRIGESAARDQRISVSCSKDSGECGQGWFQTANPEALADTLAPLLHWRLCHIYDWLYFEQDRHGYHVEKIAVVYGEDDVRTGCTGCNLVDHDSALEKIILIPEWAHLAPLLELKRLFRELTKPKWRLRKPVPEQRQDGKYAKNGQRMGPLTMGARAYGLETVLDIQRRAGVDLINAIEEARIRELWALNTWPDGWAGDEPVADEVLARISGIGHDLIVQPLLVKES